MGECDDAHAAFARAADGFFYRLWLLQCVINRADISGNTFARARSRGNHSWVEYVALDNDKGGKAARGFPSLLVTSSRCLSKPNMEPRLDLCTHLPLRLRHRALAVDLAELMNRSIGDELRAITVVTGGAPLALVLSDDLARLVHATVVCFRHLQTILRGFARAPSVTNFTPRFEIEV